MDKQNNIDALPADQLNNDFIQIFYPIHIIQRILGFLRIKIKYRYPTAPSISYIFYTHAVWIVNSVCIADYLFNNNCGNKNDSKYVDSILKLGVAMHGINSILIIWRNNMHSRNAICQLYVKLQNIDRCLNMKNSKQANRTLATFSLTITVGVCILYLVWLVLFNVLIIKKICLVTTITLVTSMGIYVEITHVYLLICFFIVRLNYVLHLLKQATLVLSHSVNIRDNMDIFSLSSNFSENSCDKVALEVTCGMYALLDALWEFRKHYQFSVSKSS